VKLSYTAGILHLCDFSLGDEMQMTISLGDWQIPLWSVAGASLALVVALLIHFSLFRLAHRLNLKKQTVLAQAFLHCEKPMRLILLLVWRSVHFRFFRSANR
jgi:hypothetical protein